MKPKEIVISVVSLVIIVGSIIIFFRMQGGNQTQQPAQSSQANTVEFNGNLDKYDKVMESVEGYTDYGIPTLDNLGRTNPFAPVQ